MLERPMSLSLYCSIFGKLIKDLLKSYSMGTNHYPQTRANIHDTIIGLHIAVDQVVIIILCKDDGAGECT